MGKQAVNKTSKVSKKKVPVKKVATKKTATKKRTPRASQPPVPKKFQFTLEMNGDIYTAMADTIVECVQQINPPFFKTKGNITIQNDGKVATVTLLPAALKKLLSNSTSQTVFQKRMTLALK